LQLEASDDPGARAEAIEDAVLFHPGFLTALQNERQQQRLDTFEPDLGPAVPQQAGGEIIRVGKNAKVSALAQRLVKEILARGRVELETMGEWGQPPSIKW